MKIGVKLTTTMVIVALIAIITATIFATGSINKSFDQYLKRNLTLHEQQMQQAVVDAYKQGGWNGVKVMLRNPFSGDLHQVNGGRVKFNQRVWLVDNNGLIIADRDNLDDGRMMDPHMINQMGTPLIVSGQKVGSLVTIKPPNGALEQKFIQSIYQALLAAGLLAIAVALVLGLLLSRRLSHPLVVLASGARRVAEHELSYRVPVLSSDETGDLAQAFNQMAASLERNETLRRNMIADVAHELRTPLTILQGNLESLQEQVLEATPEVIVSLHDEVVRISRLVADLQSLVLAEAGELKIDLVEVAPAALVERVIPNFRIEAQSRGIGFEATIPPGLPPVKVDLDRISQVLCNLLMNALKYTPAGGKITLEARQNVKMLEVTVIDTGSGIDPADIPYVFERFYRVEKSRSRSSGGVGLGLAIAKSIVEASGGRIWAESTPGLGSRFSFTLPLVI